MQDYSTMKIYCPDCAKALDLYYQQQRENNELQETAEKKGYVRFKVKWLIIYIIEIILSFIFLYIAAGFTSSFNHYYDVRSSVFKYFGELNLFYKILFLSVAGIPGGIFGAITGMPTSSDEKLYREVRKIRTDTDSCLGSILYLALCGVVGNLFTIMAIVCAIVVIVQLIVFKAKEKNKADE